MVPSVSVTCHDVLVSPTPVCPAPGESCTASVVRCPAAGATIDAGGVITVDGVACSGMRAEELVWACTPCVESTNPIASNGINIVALMKCNFSPVTILECMDFLVVRLCTILRQQYRSEQCGVG